MKNLHKILTIIIIITINNSFLVKGMHIITRPRIAKKTIDIRANEFSLKLWCTQKIGYLKNTNKANNNLEEEVECIKKKIDELAIFHYKNRIDMLTNNMRDYLINHGQYPNISTINDCVNTITELKKQYDIEYNPLNIPFNSAQTVLGKVIAMDVNLFLSNKKKRLLSPLANLLINVNSKINDDDKEEIQSIIVRHFNKNKTITEDQLGNLQYILSTLDNLSFPDTKNTAEEFISKYIKSIETGQFSAPINETYVFHKPETIQLRSTIDEVMQELYDFETLSFLMDQDEKAARNNTCNEILLLPHFQTAKDAAIKKGFGDKEKRQEWLQTLRKKAAISAQPSIAE